MVKTMLKKENCYTLLKELRCRHDTFTAGSAVYIKNILKTDDGSLRCEITNGERNDCLFIKEDTKISSLFLEDPSATKEYNIAKEFFNNEREILKKKGNIAIWVFAILCLVTALVGLLIVCHGVYFAGMVLAVLGLLFGFLAPAVSHYISGFLVFKIEKQKQTELQRILYNSKKTIYKGALVQGYNFFS